MQYKFKSEVWLYPSDVASWHFVTVPKKESADIKKKKKGPKRGWGAVKVKVNIGKTSWTTSIFPDKKSDCYILPLKADVRKKEDVFAGDRLGLEIKLV